MIWLPHGQSDKGWKYPYFESLRDEDLLLVYGSRMRVVLAAKHVAIPTLAIGSYRLEYARQHARFYEPLVESLVGSERFLLYAPTWQDPEGNGTLWPTLAYLETAPRSVYRCAIRPHPNSIALDPASWERWKGRSGASFLILDNFPPVYPVLSRCEAYIGDCSSIGYDFLHFDRPLFFIGQNPFQPATGPSSYLMQAGTQIQTTDILHLLSSFTPQDYKNPRRKELLAEAFQADTDWQNQLRKFVE
jgi:CDP-glycerol glycerophosphotransferase (TagB/SpsB family)